MTASGQSFSICDNVIDLRILLLGNPQIPEMHLQRLFPLPNTMYLEGDEPSGSQAILIIGDGGSIYPGLDRFTLALDPELVPLRLLERGLGDRIGLQILEPSAPGLVVEPTRPRSGRGIDLNLVPVHPIGREFDRLALPDHLRWDIGALAPDLHPGVKLIRHLEFEFEHEIGVGPGCAKEGIPGIGDTRANNFSTYCFELRFSAVLNPTVQALAIEQRRPLFARTGGIRRRKMEYGQRRGD